MSNGRKPTLEDVAHAAEVSTATVSRYLNNPERVAFATRERIRAAVADVGYLPNLTAGALAGNRSRLIAALVPDIAQSIFNDTIEAMISELSADGNGVMLALTGQDGGRLSREIDLALARQVDAIILTGIVTDADLRARLRANPITIIETWGIPEDPIDVAVGFSHHAAGMALAEFLSGRGYRRAHLVVPRSPRALHRAKGFTSGWLSAGNEEPTRLEVGVPSHFGQGRLSFKVLSGLDPRPDVVVCGSDWIAQGLIVEASANNIRVPGDFAVTGFGNLLLAGDMRPTITTVDVDGRRIAQEVLRVLQARSANRVIENRINVGFKIVARESA